MSQTKIRGEQLENIRMEGDEATLQERMFAGRSFDDGFDYDTLPSTYSWAGSPLG